jgi:hypothetical protein
MTSTVTLGRLRRARLVIAALALSLVALGLPGASPLAANNHWIINEDALPFTPRPGAEAYWGVHAGAAYRMEVPANWNGDLVLFAHGYVAETNPVLSVGIPSLRDHWLSQGYAWAASSYRANGYVPGTGALDTHRLIGLFRGKVGNPDRVYITGTSLGGHVTGVAIEQWPNSFDGALPLCGVMGGNDLFEYFQDAYLVAETLAWGEAEVPTPDGYPTSGWPATRSVLGGGGAGFPWTLSPTGERYRDTIMHLTGGERPGFEQGFTSFVFNGAFIFNFGSAVYYGLDNTDRVYRWTSGPELTPEEQEFNDTIFRSSGLPRLQRPNGLGGWPQSSAVSPPINGTFRIPVVSLHTLGDMFVPFSMQQAYAERAAANGRDDLLAVRAIRGTSHCDFQLSELQQAWDDLVRWVEEGIPAEGDDILDPAAVAEPTFGCRFSAQRAGAMACPT